jgi:protein TonB
MFDLVMERVERPFRKSSATSRLLAIVGHTAIAGGLIATPLFVVDELPNVPTMMAFVVEAGVPPPPPPPPPPPAPPPAASAVRPIPEKTVGSASPDAAPIEAPAEIRPETHIAAAAEMHGVEGGIEGGIAGGVVGGIVGGVMLPPPPPPLPPAAPRGPVRIGGQIVAPALVYRVEPKYPDMAVLAKVAGVVILEATVDADGLVESVKVLRGRGLGLDQAATAALKQWRYSPLVLNGHATPFVLTVTFSFSFK